jgi:hypothetical protein
MWPGESAEDAPNEKHQRRDDAHRYQCRGYNTYRLERPWYSTCSDVRGGDTKEFKAVGHGVDGVDEHLVKAR